MAVLLTNNLGEYRDFIKKYQSEKPEYTFWETRREWRLKNVLQERYEKQKKYTEEKFLPYMEERGAADMELCDLACACGDFTFLTAGKFKHVDGFDLSPLMIKKAKEYAAANGVTNVSFQRADAKEIEFKKTYGAFMIHGLFTYIFEDLDFLKILDKVQSATSGGGILFVKDTLSTRDETYYYSSTHSEYVAIYRPKKRYLETFREKGFELEDETLLSGGEETPENEREAGLESRLMIFKMV